MKTQNFFGAFLMTISLFFILYFFVLSLGWSMSKNEITECRKWQEQSAQYSGFYLVRWQKEQCDAQNIIIDAIVK